jgi:anti-sigma-K factor RskA
MTDIDVHHLAAAYALDALDERERGAFEAHYGSCDVCHSDVQEMRRTLTSVAGSLAVPAPMSLKDRVMAEVAVTRQLSPSLVPIALPPRRRLGPMIMVAAAAVMLLVGIAVFARRDTADSFSADLARVMEQPDSQVLTLENKSGGEGTFKVAWSSELGEAVLIGENLPTTPDDKAYELWLIAGDQAMAMYVLDPAEDGNVHRRLDAPADPTAWAITVEPKEGTPTATGDIIYIADV